MPRPARPARRERGRLTVLQLCLSFFFFSSRRRHTRWTGDWSSDVCSSDLMAMHDCDVMLCIGARFDDRITGRINAFSPNSKKIHIDIDPSSINKNVRADIGILGDVGHVLEDFVRLWRATVKADKKALYPWWEQIAKWRARDSFAYRPSDDVIMPQYAIQRLFEA